MDDGMEETKGGEEGGEEEPQIIFVRGVFWKVTDVK